MMPCMANGITELIREATGGGRPGKERKITDFAEAIGTTPTTVTRWRDGTIPGPKWRAALARYFNTTEDDIDLASRLVGVTLDDLAVTLDAVLTEVRAHRQAVLEADEAMAEAMGGVRRRLAAVERRLAKLELPQRTSAA